MSESHPLACGTATGYRAHLARREVTCRACCDARSAVSATRRAADRLLRGRPDAPHMYAAARDGRIPAEVLTTSDRSRLVADLHRMNWTDRAIAEHTCMTEYTTARIRSALGLRANRASRSKGVA